MLNVSLPRRVLLLGLPAIAVAGCSVSGTDVDPGTAAATDDQLLDEWDLIAAYDMALTERDDPELRAIRDQHVAHARALGGEIAASPTPSNAPTTPPGRRQLRRLEATAARQRRAAAIASGDLERSQLLSLIAASEFQHSLQLEQA